MFHVFFQRAFSSIVYELFPRQIREINPFEIWNNPTGMPGYFINFFYNWEKIFIPKQIFINCILSEMPNLVLSENHRSISHTVVSIFLNYIYVSVNFFLNFASPSRTWKTDIVDGECDCKVVFFKLKKKKDKAVTKSSLFFRSEMSYKFESHYHVMNTSLGTH